VDSYSSNGKDSARSQPNREYRTADYWRDDSFKAATVYRKLSFEDRMLVIEDGATPSCDSAQRTGRLGWRNFTEPAEAFAHALHPQRCRGR
jgi:hypothetical protein